MRYVIGIVILLIIIFVVFRFISGGSQGTSTYGSLPGYTVTTSSNNMVNPSQGYYGSGNAGYSSQGQRSYSSYSSYSRPASMQQQSYGYNMPQAGYQDYGYYNMPAMIYAAAPTTYYSYPITTDTRITPSSGGFCNNACSCNYCSPDLITRQMYSQFYGFRQYPW